MSIFGSGFLRGLAIPGFVLIASNLAAAQSASSPTDSFPTAAALSQTVSTSREASKVTSSMPSQCPEPPRAGAPTACAKTAAAEKPAATAPPAQNTIAETTPALAPELPCPLSLSFVSLHTDSESVASPPLAVILLPLEPVESRNPDNSIGISPDSGQTNSTSGTPSAKPSLEREFFKNILRDQRAIWTAPFHIRRDQAYWLLPLAGATAALMVTDRYSAEEGGEFAAISTHQTVSDRISSIGAIYLPAAALGSLYLVGRITGNDRARETAVLAAEAAVDTAIVGQGLKLIFERQRPSSSDGEGEFWSGGSSFPSGHSIEAWSIATVIANEYHDHLWVEIAAYSTASVVSVSRFTGHHHFLSDVLVGSALGYGIGRYVYRDHHHVPGGADSGGRHILSRIRSRVAVAPIYNPAIRAYGGTLNYALR